MNPWHLLWIVPLAQLAGFMVAAVLAAGSESRHASHLAGELNRVKSERDALLYQYEWHGE